MRYVTYQEADDMAMDRDVLIHVVQNCLFLWAKPYANMNFGSLIEYYEVERKELLQLLKERL